MAAAKMFNEGDFERAACRAHNELGEASPVSIDLMLQSEGGRLLRVSERQSGLSLERKDR